MLYLYFRLIYLFHVIPSSSLSSGPFTDPRHYLILAVVPLDSYAQPLVRHSVEPLLGLCAFTSTMLLPMAFGEKRAGRQARTYIQQFFADTGYILEELPGAIDDWDGWRERIREIRAGMMMMMMMIIIIQSVYIWLHIYIYASMSIHTKRNICALIKQATSPH